MHRHALPSDTKGAEKIIGGILDLYQGLWIGIPLVLGMGTIITFYQVLGVFIAVLMVPICFVGVPFAFFKKEDLTLFQYLRLYYQSKKKKLILTKERE